MSFLKKLLGKKRQGLKTLAEQEKKVDIQGLLSQFNKGSWDSREWTVVSIDNTLKNSRIGLDYDKSEMIKLCEDIILVCKASKTGGSYRTNCREWIQRSLKWLKEQP